MVMETGVLEKPVKKCVNPSGALLFIRRQQNVWEKIHCSSHLKCGNEIKKGQIMWGSGNVFAERYLICQKCFGFWRSRYSIFDYVGEFDKKDIYWKEYWDKQLESNELINFLALITI